MSPMRRLGLVGVVVAVAVMGVSAGSNRSAASTVAALEQAAPLVSPSFVAGNFCLTRNTAEQYNTMFDSEPGGVIGADYQRVTPMANGNVLWTFQDAEVRLPGGTSTLVHNIGMVQSGTCFAVLMGGTRAAPRPWLFASDTTQFSHWYWPLDATMGADGRMYVYAAEMVEHGDTYLTHVEPISTVIAGVNIDNGNVESQRRALNGSPDLYGWASASNDDWTYLYAQCYRQFGYDLFYDGFRIHDSECADEFRVARVPRGQLFARHEYWTGNGWSQQPSQATTILETNGRLANPADIVYVNNHWLAIIKVDDWFGNEILIEASPRPTGPFETIAVLEATPRCDPTVCNTYYASWIPTGQHGPTMIGLSNNRWDGAPSDVYRPTYRPIEPPKYQMSPANRCSLGQCD